MHAANQRARTRSGPRPRGRLRHLWIAAVGTALATACALVLVPLTDASAAPSTNAESAGSLPACPFWDASVTPPARTVTPWVPPGQTASAVNFTSRPAAPTLTGTLANGEITPTPPASWPAGRFDIVYVFIRATRSDGWTFSQIPQMLLAGDSSSPIS